MTRFPYTLLLQKGTKRTLTQSRMQLKCHGQCLLSISWVRALFCRRDCICTIITNVKVCRIWGWVEVPKTGEFALNVVTYFVGLKELEFLHCMHHIMYKLQKIL